LDDVRRALELPRPGRAAQVKLSPRPRLGDVYPVPPDLPRKHAGVMILLYPHNDTLNFILTLRTDKVETHKGQVSFPGGAREEGETLRETALRETCEELNIDPAYIEILGEPLSPVYIGVSGFMVTPFVGYACERPLVRAAPDEVVEIIETPLDLILDETIVAEEAWEFDPSYKPVVPFFSINGHKVWGATAMMLSELREMLGQVKTGNEKGKT
jgi:8-oxo-dGTP pyrophosphatase MutT (NUDIX family)